MVTPVLSSSVMNVAAPIQSPLINAQEVLRKAQEDAKVKLNSTRNENSIVYLWYDDFAGQTTAGRIETKIIR